MRSDGLTVSGLSLSFAFQLPPSLSPAAVKKLIEKRNERFEHAVNEYAFSSCDGV